MSSPPSNGCPFDVSANNIRENLQNQESDEQMKAYYEAGTIIRSLLVIMLGALLCSPVMANDGSTASIKQVLATALGIDLNHVRTVCQIALNGASDLQAVVLGTYSVSGNERAVAVPVYPVDTAAKTRVALDLMPGQSVEFLGAFDLSRAPTAISLEARACASGGEVVEMKGLKQAALLVKVRNQSLSTQDSLILLTVERSPRLIWAQTIRSIAANGAGYETVGMRLEAGRTNTLDLVLIQHELPARNESPYMPGPPLALRFQLINGVYKRGEP